MDVYSVVKSLHIIFVVTWFAGLFYIYRLFIYHTEAQDKSQAERQILSSQLMIMQRRLWYGITWPSAIVTLICGISLLYLNPWFLNQTFFQIKILFLVGLYTYHFYSHGIFLQLQKGVFKLTSSRLRILNEFATIFLVAIVFIIELQNSMSWLYAVLGLFAFIAVLMIAIKVYKSFRK